MSDQEQERESAYHLERTVLGCLLKRPEEFAATAQTVKAEAFAHDAHRLIFEAMAHLEDVRVPLELATVANRLHELGKVKDVGGYPYLAQLFESAGTGYHLEHHRRLLRDRVLTRKLIMAANEIARDAQDHVAHADDLVSQAERKILALADYGVAGQATPLADAVSESCDRFDHRSNLAAQGKAHQGLATGFEDLDLLTAGLHASELVILAARPSQGKTAMALAIVRHALHSGATVFFASIEMSRHELTDRLLCSEAGIDSHKFRSGNLQPFELDMLAAARDSLRDLNGHIDDGSCQSMLRISANARRIKHRHGLDLVVVDYLQLVEPDDHRIPRHEQVASISRRLKQLARELKVPVLALAQLGRGVEERQGQQPRLSDLRESGSIEADADTVLLIHKQKREDDKYSTDSLIELIIAKQRNGPLGDLLLRFRRDCFRFETYSDDRSMVR